MRKIIAKVAKKSQIKAKKLSISVDFYNYLFFFFAQIAVKSDKPAIIKQ